jgi:ketosteroid isomerase-like protein
MSVLEDVEAIKKLKYRYFRHLDGKQWDELGRLLTDDAVCRYDEGKYSYDGREAILGFLRDSLDNPKIATMHHGHHPEIEVDGDRASGVWYLEDYVVFSDLGSALHGTAFYSDEYVKEGGQWRISSTGYKRVFEEFVDRSSVQSFRSMFDAD